MGTNHKRLHMSHQRYYSRYNLTNRAHTIFGTLDQPIQPVGWEVD